MSKIHQEFVLGIDIGTTSIKTCLVEASSKKVVSLTTKETASTLPPDVPLGSLQDPGRIYYALHSCMNRLPKDKLSCVRRITFCGQMHGVVLWRKASCCRRKSKNSSSDQFEVGDVSPLYTWQDKRCTSEFLETLPDPDSHLRLSSGYGCITLAWLAQKGLLKNYDHCGTIMDFIIGMLTENSSPGISLQNAASFGYCNTLTGTWNVDQLKRIPDFPLHILPRISTGDECLKSSWFDISPGTMISPSLGDFQCSVLATMKGLKSAVLNLSTSAQLAFVVQEQDFVPRRDSEIVEYFPFFDNQYMAVAASLTGGNAMAEFVKAIQTWVLDLGLSITQSKIWERLLVLGLSNFDEEPLEVKPTIFGERHTPEAKGEVRNIAPGNITLGALTSGICRGIVQNLASMMSPQDLKRAGITLVVGSGSALLKNKIIQREITQSYSELSVEFVEEGHACFGAALHGINLLLD